MPFARRRSTQRRNLTLQILRKRHNLQPDFPLQPRSLVGNPLLALSIFIDEHELRPTDLNAMNQGIFRQIVIDQCRGTANCPQS